MFSVSILNQLCNLIRYSVACVRAVWLSTPWSCSYGCVCLLCCVSCVLHIVPLVPCSLWKRRWMDATCGSWWNRLVCYNWVRECDREGCRTVTCLPLCHHGRLDLVGRGWSYNVCEMSTNLCIVTLPFHSNCVLSGLATFCMCMLFGTIICRKMPQQYNIFIVSACVSISNNVQKG